MSPLWERICSQLAYRRARVWRSVASGGIPPPNLAGFRTLESDSRVEDPLRDGAVRWGCHTPVRYRAQVCDFAPPRA